MTNFPAALDTFTNPTSQASQKTLSHADQHTKANNAIAALQAKVGINSSDDIDSLEYKINNTYTARRFHAYNSINKTKRR